MGGLAGGGGGAASSPSPPLAPVPSSSPGRVSAGDVGSGKGEADAGGDGGGGGVSVVDKVDRIAVLVVVVCWLDFLLPTLKVKALLPFGGTIETLLPCVDPAYCKSKLISE